MDTDRDASRLNAEAPATDATPNKPPLAIGEAETKSPKVDSTLNEPHQVQRIDRPDGANSATEAGFMIQSILGASEEGGLDGTGKLKPQDEPVLGASSNPELDAQSVQPSNEIDSPVTEEEVDSDDGDTVSESGTLDSRSKRRQSLSTLGHMTKALKKRIAKAPKRLLQQARYAMLVENRLADVERRLEEMESRSPNMIEDERDTDPASLLSRVATPEPKKNDMETLGIKRVIFEQYKPHKTSEPKPTIEGLGLQHQAGFYSVPKLPKRHIIEVVMPYSAGEAFQSSSGVNPLGVSTAAKFPFRDAATERPAVGNTQHVIPERIRINSSLLLRTIENITGHNFTRLDLAGHKAELKSQVILKPFKILVTYEHKIREYARDLKEKLAIFQAKGSEQKYTSEATGVVSPELVAIENIGLRPGGMSGSRNRSSDSLAAQSAETEISTAEEINEESERCLQEIQVLVEVLDNDLKPVFDLRRRIQEGDIRNIAFCDLWHLFRIGGDIRLNERHSQVYRILFTTGGRPALCTRSEARMPPLEADAEVDEPSMFTISCWCYGFDAKCLGPIQRIFEIRKYDRPKPITSLSVYPVEFSPSDDSDMKREDFVRRGRKFVELTKDNSSVVHKRYRGLSINLEGIREEVDSEVIIDTSMALLKNPSLEVNVGPPKRLEWNPVEFLEFLDPDGCKIEGCHQNTAVHKDYWVDVERDDSIYRSARYYWDLAESASSMRPENFLVCPGMVYGYVLRSRKWMSLDVGVVEDIAVQEFGFDSLVLPKGHSETLLALVETHSKAAKPATGKKVVERQNDLIRGKGKGLIILLHGEPGVGKTSTAECVSEYTKRPLFQVTCGDIGSSAEVVERTLENHFQLAHKWGCVLLLDEADVFLMSRSKQDLKRNAIVSVFLRVLEYYSGILFLTTNRVGTFDPAFRSRIHMSFFYPKLNLKTTLEIWKKNLDRTRKMWAENIEIDPEEREKILGFAEDHFKDSEKMKTTWNGRQIRNGFQTAIALAEYEVHKARKRFKMAEDPVPRLEAWQFEKVAEASKHFDEYLKATVGLEEDRARENFERRDDLGVEDLDMDAGSRRRSTIRT